MPEVDASVVIQIKVFDRTSDQVLEGVESSFGVLSIVHLQRGPG
jgi:hypothetical protein